MAQAPPPHGSLNPDVPSGVAEASVSVETTGHDQTAADRTPEEAFEAFLKERYSMLVGTVRLIVRDTGIAEDLVQETFARAYIYWARLWPDGNPGGWVHRVATNLAISWRRRALREVRAVARLGRWEQTSTPAPEVHPELERAVAALPVRQRTAVSLYYVLGLPVNEVAEAMGCRPGTVKSLLFQARERLCAQLGDGEQ